MPGERRARRSRANRWYRHHGHGVHQEVAQDTISGDRVRRVFDSYRPFCATDIKCVGPRNIARCPNTRICGKALPIDADSCPNCCHYTRPGDNFCRICRTNLRGVVRGHGGLYQQLGRAPSPLQNSSPPRQQPEPQYLDLESDSSSTDDEEDGEEEGDRHIRNAHDVVVPPADAIQVNEINNEGNQAVNQQQQQQQAA